MLVESRVKFGGDGKAVVDLPAQVIGNIQTAAGYGTVRRADGTAAQAMVGDPVCQGDVIETAADGRLGIRFIDAHPVLYDVGWLPSMGKSLLQ